MTAALRCGLAALLCGLLPAGAGAGPVQSADLPGMVRVTIDVELSCPSCAAGLERRLGRLDHVAGVEVSPADGRIAIGVEPGHRLDLAAVRDTVRNAGFFPGGMAVTAIGRVIDVDGAPALALSPEFALPLAAADGLADLAAEAGGRPVRVTGQWLAPQDGAARLQVESLEIP